MTVNIFVDGDKNGFNSKNAFQRFKETARATTNIDELNKYLKSDYIVSLISRTESELRFNIVKVVNVNKKDEFLEQKKSMLKAELKARAYVRANKKMPENQKTSVTSDMDTLLFEYMRLKKTTKMPVPSPKEALANPMQYKQLVSMVLNNPSIKSLDQDNPYLRYFTLLANAMKLDQSEEPYQAPVQEVETVPELVSARPTTFDNLLNSVTNTPIQDVQGTIKEGDVDTEEED
jgi:hypothetical protein